jgi:hypothetical protein
MIKESEEKHINIDSYIDYNQIQINDIIEVVCENEKNSSKLFPIIY